MQSYYCFVCQLYVKDKEMAKNYTLKQLFRCILAVSMKKGYKEKWKIYIQSYTDGYKDGYSGNMGKNQKFLPGM